MAKGRSLQDLIRSRQQSGFVGRQQQVVQYQENLGLAVDDERRRFLFNIHGDAGVGKTDERGFGITCRSELRGA